MNLLLLVRASGRGSGRGGGWVPFSSGVSVAVLEAAGGARRAVGGEDRQLAVGRVGVALDQGSAASLSPTIEYCWLR